MGKSNNDKPNLLYIDDSPEFLLLFKTVLKDDYNYNHNAIGQRGVGVFKEQ